MKIFKEQSFQKKQTGFVLPTVLVLSIVLLTLGLSVFQLSSNVARSLTDQYWQRMSKQAAQAGVSYMSACVDQGLSASTWPTTITQDNNCLGTTLGSYTSLFTNTTDTNPSPSPYKSSFTIYRPTTGTDGIPKARVVGTVEVLNTAGTTVIKSYTTDMLGIVNGSTRSFTQIGAGYKHTCGLTDGRVYCWGSNAVDPPTADNTITGQLGTGSSSIDATTPTLVGGALSGKFVTSLSVGYNFTCAIANGQVYCWGDNSMGQLGNGNNTSYNTPQLVNSGTLSGKTVAAVGAGGDFACAIANGQVYCWGNGSHGQHGNNTTNTTNTPDTVVSTITNVSSLSVGANHACAIANGTGYCWGNGASGQLGNGTYNDPQRTPAQVAGSGPGSALVNKIFANNNYTCALVIGAVPYCWGYNEFGQLGTGSNSTFYYNTAQPLNTSNIVGIITDMTASPSSTYHTCALANGNAYCWGTGWAGQLGNNSTALSNRPVAVNTSGLLPTNRTITNIAAGGAHTCALAEGQPYCWGKGAAGSLGDGVDNASCGCDYYPNSVPKKTINTY